PHDVIVSVNGNAVTSAADVSNYIGLLRVGTPLTLGMLRNGKPVTIHATIGKAQSEQVAATNSSPLRGITVANIDESSPLYGQVKGVMVTSVDPNSEAAEAGVRRGDVVTAVNREPVTNVAQFQKALKDAGSTIALLIQRNGQNIYIVLNG
ncbi:MAG: PDZ domain-containing protein, partial [Gammaproteobacteria bacterium]|nr:PDZ domain-containing protein [Gammaproteobacteria bacterium]